MKPTIKHLSRVLCCTEAQVRAQLSKNLASMREDLAQANRTGRPVRGYSAERIENDISEMESRLSR
jgi:predicted DNA-binding protein